MNRKRTYFPELSGESLESIEIERVSPDWAKNTCVTKYIIHFSGNTIKSIRGTASHNGLKQVAWGIMQFLWRQGFNSGKTRIAQPLDFLPEQDALFYEEAPGIPLVSIMQTKSRDEISERLKDVAAWLVALHELNPLGSTLPPARSVGVDEYRKVFGDLRETGPEIGFDLDLAFLDTLGSPEVTLIHNDFYPGNIIIDATTVFGIDFEKSGMGSPYCDLATMTSWFELPVQDSTSIFAQGELKGFRRVFLESYCQLRHLDSDKTIRNLNKYLAKVFLDQAYEFAIIYLEGYKNSNEHVRDHYRRMVISLLDKFEKKLSLK